jgi:hypothetical protein
MTVKQLAIGFKFLPTLIILVTYECKLNEALEKVGYEPAP